MEKAVEVGAERAEKSLEAAVSGVESDVREKVEGGAKTALWDIYGPHPSLALFKFWQGIVELCLAVTVIGLSVAILIAASVSFSDVSIDTTGANSDIVELVNDSRSAAGYMIFVGIFAILFELTLIVVRFINLGAVNHFFCIFVILVMIMMAIVGVLSLSGGIVAAVEGDNWQDQLDTWESQGVEIYSRGYRIPKNLDATAAFGILTTVALVVQGVWLIFYLVFGWNKHMPTTSVLSGIVKGVEKETITL